MLIRRSLSPIFSFLYCALLIFNSSSFALEQRSQNTLPTLSNGIVYQHIQSDINVARLAIFVKAGHLYNGDAHGVSHLTEHLFNLGGDAKNVSKIDDFLASVNGTRRATLNTSGVRYWYEIPTEYLGGLLPLIQESLVGVTASEDAIAAQIAAIDNEWKQGQRYQELIDWEQTFRVFAHTDLTLKDGSFFMGSTAEFQKYAARLQDELKRLFSRYNGKNITILSESSHSKESAFKLMEKTIGAVELSERDHAQRMTQEPSLHFTPVTEVRKKQNHDDKEVQFTFAVPPIASAPPVFTRFLIHLLKHSSIHTVSLGQATLQFSPTSIEFSPNAFHQFDSLHMTFPRREVEGGSIYEDARQFLSIFNSVLLSLAAVEREAELVSVYNDFAMEYRLTCSQKNLSFELAKELDNQVHFGRLTDWLNACHIPQKLDRALFRRFVETFVSAKTYTKLFVNDDEWVSLKNKDVMEHYDQPYVLLESTRKNEVNTPLSFRFPRKNALVEMVEKSIVAKKDVRLRAVEDGKFASHRVLKAGISHIHDYAEALIIKAHLEAKYSKWLSDADALGTPVTFLIDDKLSIVASGRKSLATYLANAIEVPISVLGDDLAKAKTDAISAIEKKVNDNQVFRMNEFLARIQSNHIWSDEQLLAAIRRYPTKSPDSVSHALPAPSSQNLELKNNAPVNILASLRQVQTGSLEEKVYAVLLNSIIRSDYKERFRNTLKIAYTAITGHKVSDKGTGFVTLLQTSTHSISDMKKMNHHFFTDMLSKVQRLTEQEFLQLSDESKKEVIRLSNQLDYVFADRLISQTDETSINSMKLSLSEFKRFSKRLLSNDLAERYVAIIGIENNTKNNENR
ncbi:insulinase family protein [Pseudoalteromonas galatheae]|uniref:insulinase family protein n=1 Tax=Pseudoalteromonas galatheae TaxID=579562 RepID=UPI0011095885|nr:insulinase family protein [Pseudoalteromonas galatheae]NKC20960.1 hypothetical protein [Pseudoalteromonas galatheae]